MSVDINLSPGCCRAIMGPERCNTEAGGAMAFAENLRRLRLERFLSQAELARRAGMHAITITRLEAGDRAPTTRTVRASPMRSAWSRATWPRRMKWRRLACWGAGVDALWSAGSPFETWGKVGRQEEKDEDQ